MSIPFKLSPLGLENGGLPAGFKRVEYLESDGSANIALPFSDNSETYEKITITTDIQFLTNSRTLIGFKGTSGFYWGSTETGYLEIGGNAYLTILPFSRNVVIFELWKHEYYAEAWRNILKTGADEINRESAPSSLPSLWEFGLFALRETDGYRGRVRLWSCKATQGDVQFDLVPCLDNTGSPCMFDLVTRQPYYNQGTGDFTYA